MEPRHPKHPVVEEIEALADRVPEGAVCAFGGGWLSSKPMAMIRELVQRDRSVQAVTVLGSLDIDLLAAAGLLRSVDYSFVSLDAFGTARAFRRAVEDDGLAANARTGFELIVGVEASARGVPELTTVGTDGQTVDVPAVPVDVALLHAAAVDEAGNVGLTASPFLDLQFARAADTVLVTAERRCKRLQDCGRLTGGIPRFLVDAVAVVPFGAHPTAAEPTYSMDPWALAEWARDRVATLERWRVPHDVYMREVIGPERQERLI